MSPVLAQFRQMPRSKLMSAFRGAAEVWSITKGQVSFSPPYSEGLNGPRRRDLFRLDRATLARSRWSRWPGYHANGVQGRDRFTVIPPVGKKQN